MKLTFGQVLKKFADEYGYSYRDDYSGRFMFGRSCVGVTGPKSMDMELIDYLYENGYKFVKVAKTRAWDQMGLNYIMYFPTVTE